MSTKSSKVPRLMMKMEHKSMLVNCFLMSLVLMVSQKCFTEAQTTQTCATKLEPCVAYLNSTHPPDSCCSPLKEAVQNELPCLCSLYETPGLLQSVGLNITTANDLSHRCGIDSSTSDCKKVLAPRPSHSETPPPPGSPGKNNGGASGVAYSGVSFVILFWASMMLY